MNYHLQENLDFETELPSLSEIWAKKYVAKLKARDNYLYSLEAAKFRIEIAQNLTELLRSISAAAWHKTESLLANEIRRHHISTELLDPWLITKDVYQVYEKTLSAYANHISPQQLSVAIAADIGKIRQTYTAIDPRVIGFVSMQFHYCGHLIVNQVDHTIQETLAAYFKVIDDHLYMPLQRAYEAAASCNYDSPRLQTVHHLLPHSSKIAVSVVETVIQRHPTYTTHSGQLNDPAVRVSSIRDVEMFQVYLWTCVLEQNISAITQELFPLCVMLYPRLNISWELVREMLTLLHQSFTEYGNASDKGYYQPYHDSLWRMFSTAVLE